MAWKGANSRLPRRFQYLVIGFLLIFSITDVLPELAYRNVWAIPLGRLICSAGSRSQGGYTDPNLSSALDRLQRDLVWVPRTESSRRLLGVAYYRAGDRERALHEWRELPDLAGYLLTWGDNVRAHGRSGQALEWYLLAAEMEPSSSLAWYRVGQEYKGQAHWKEALAAFRRALEADAWVSLDAERADAYHQVALLLFRKGSWSEALSVLRDALAMAPDSADLWGDLAWASYQSDGGMEQAWTYMQHALVLAPGDADLLLRAADLYRLESEYDEALEWVTRARAVEPGNVWVLIAQGRIEFDRGDYTQAIGTFGDAVRLSPDTARAHFWLGRAYQADDRWVDATAAYQTAFELMPGQIEFGLWLGDAYRQTGKLDEAIATYQQVLAHNPGHQGAQRRLQETLEQE